MLRREIVKESAPLLDEIDQSANQIHTRSSAEQEKLKVYFKINFFFLLILLLSFLFLKKF